MSTVFLQMGNSFELCWRRQEFFLIVWPPFIYMLAAARNDQLHICRSNVVCGAFIYMDTCISFHFLCCFLYLLCCTGLSNPVKVLLWTQFIYLHTKQSLSQLLNEIKCLYNRACIFLQQHKGDNREVQESHCWCFCYLLNSGDQCSSK